MYVFYKSYIFSGIFFYLFIFLIKLSICKKNICISFEKTLICKKTQSVKKVHSVQKKSILRKKKSFWKIKNIILEKKIHSVKKLFFKISFTFNLVLQQMSRFKRKWKNVTIFLRLCSCNLVFKLSIVLQNQIFFCRIKKTCYMLNKRLFKFTFSLFIAVVRSSRFLIKMSRVKFFSFVRHLARMPQKCQQHFFYIIYCKRLPRKTTFLSNS